MREIIGICHEPDCEQEGVVTVADLDGYCPWCGGRVEEIEVVANGGYAARRGNTLRLALEGLAESCSGIDLRSLAYLVSLPPGSLRSGEEIKTAIGAAHRAALVCRLESMTRRHLIERRQAELPARSLYGVTAIGRYVSRLKPPLERAA